jgi:hypothetical protein
MHSKFCSLTWTGAIEPLGSGKLRVVSTHFFKSSRPTKGDMPEQILRVSDIEHFHWSLSEADVPISFSNHQGTLSLAASVELACIGACASGAKQTQLSAIRVGNSPIWSLLRASQWPRRRNRGKLCNDGSAVVVLPRDANDPWWTDRLREILSELRANGFPARLARGLTGAVAEMADNVWLHSESGEPGLVAYQIRRRRFAFSVADVGIGVLASIRTNSRYRWLNSSMEAIQCVIQPGVSRNDGGGMGFPSLLHALAELWGNARFRSGEASLLIDRTHEDKKLDFLYLPHLPGLHVSARCSLDAPRQPHS